MNWKALSIILIILIIIETSIFGSLYYIGAKEINNENKCANSICRVGDYDTYLYDPIGNACYCYIDHELVHSEYMGD